MFEKTSLSQRWANMTFGKTQLFWACAATAVATVIVGFSWGGWVTGGTSRKLVDEAAENSRYMLAATICMDRFKAAVDAPAQLAAFKELKSWERTQFVEKGGWAVMPGAAAERRDRSAAICADQLVAVELGPNAAVLVK